jgi:hypothetical protein
MNVLWGTCVRASARLYVYWPEVNNEFRSNLKFGVYSKVYRWSLILISIKYKSTLYEKPDFINLSQKRLVQRQSVVIHLKSETHRPTQFTNLAPT